MPTKLQERDFAGTPYVPVYVMLPVSLLSLLTYHHTYSVQVCAMYLSESSVMWSYQLFPFIFLL